VCNVCALKKKKRLKRDLKKQGIKRLKHVPIPTPRSMCDKIHTCSHFTVCHPGRAPSSAQYPQDSRKPFQGLITHFMPVGSLSDSRWHAWACNSTNQSGLLLSLDRMCSCRMAMPPSSEKRLHLAQQTTI
jgi:hypothetical protein